MVPESVVGSISAPEFETFGSALDLKFKTRTYFGIQGEILRARADQTIGGFDYANLTAPALPSSTQNLLDYQEQAGSFTINQLLSDEWALGARYRFCRSDYDSFFPKIPLTNINLHDKADLHEFNLSLFYNHPSGFFAQAESKWFLQYNGGTSSTLGDESINQVNLFCGYRFHRQRAKLTLGVMNLNDADYRLNPLNVYNELPRERVFVARLLVNF